MAYPTFNHPRFIVDAMLGNIAKKLRLFGFDTEYQSDIDDEFLIKKALAQTRIVITKDKRLYQTLKESEIIALLPSSNIELRILVEILNQCNISHVNILPNPFTRCTLCNGLLITIKKILAIDSIPWKVFERIDIVYRCTKCSKVYWNGTHIRQINEQVQEINKHLDYYGSI